MHVPTHNYAGIDGNLEEILHRVIDALFHVRDADGPSAFVVSVFLPEAQCHLLCAIDEETPHRCTLTVVSQSVEGGDVVTQRTANEYEQAVQYVRHILLEFDRQKQISNLLVTTDGRRVRGVLSQTRQHAELEIEE